MKYEDLTAAQKLNTIVSIPNPILKFKSINELHAIILHGKFLVGHFIVIKEKDELIFCNNKADLFEKHNAIGVIREIITNDLFEFERLFFKLANRTYKTDKQTFKKFGITETFNFGSKIFLPLKYFNNDQFSLAL
jgi:hypothetical protein